MINGISTDKDVADPEESYQAIAESIYKATTSEQLDEIGVSLYKPRPNTAIPAFNFDFGTASGLEPSETKAIRNEIISALQPQFADSLGTDPNGNIFVLQSAKPEVANVFALAEERARNMATGPIREYSATDAAAQVAKNIRIAVTEGNFDAKTIADNFDKVMIDPMAFVQGYTPPPVAPVVPPTTPEQEFDAFGNSLEESFRVGQR